MPRPQTIEEFHAAMAKLASPEGRGRGLAFKPRVTDVIISPYGKSGTTMLQQMVHPLMDKLQLMLKVAVYERWGAGGLHEFWENDGNFRTGEFETVDRLYSEIRRKRRSPSPS